MIGSLIRLSSEKRVGDSACNLIYALVEAAYGMASVSRID